MANLTLKQTQWLIGLAISIVLIPVGVWLVNSSYVYKTDIEVIKVKLEQNAKDHGEIMSYIKDIQSDVKKLTVGKSTGGKIALNLEGFLNEKQEVNY